jgi:hypothetical protein
MWQLHMLCIVFHIFIWRAFYFATEFEEWREITRTVLFCWKNMNGTALSIKEDNLMLILTRDKSCNIPMGLSVLITCWLMLGHFVRAPWKVMCNITISQHVLYLYLQVRLHKSVTKLKQNLCYRGPYNWQIVYSQHNVCFQFCLPLLRSCVLCNFCKA